MPETPAPRRPGQAGVSLRTQRPTTFYDTEKNSSSQPALPDGSRLPAKRPAKTGGLPSAMRTGTKNPNSHRLPPSSDPARGQPITNPAGAHPNEKSKVGAALLSKRQSVSYGKEPKRTPEPMPSMPTLSGRLGDDRIGRGLRKQGSPSPIIDLDTETLSQDNFDAEKFLTIHLATLGGATSDPEILKVFKDSLSATHQATDQSLQENAYKNYGAFVAVSKEISTIENEMLELKSALEEFRTLPNDLDVGLGLMSGSSVLGDIKKKSARNSVADVNALYKTQLESLWEKVEGSQKFLPIQPGRHIISESKTFVELNPITYQLKQPVHIFLLDDSLLIATQKPPPMASGKVKLMAERCFQLLQISIMDLDDRTDLTNAIQIQRNQEKVILRTDRFQEKRDFLHTFKKVFEDLARKKRKQSTMDILNRPAESDAFRFQGAPITSRSSKNLTAKDDPANRIFSQIGDLLDEISVEIACRNFEESIELIEDSKMILSKLSKEVRAQHEELYNSFKNRIEGKTSELVDRLLDDLLVPSVRKSQLVRTSQMIVKLSGSPSSAGPYIERAKESFLLMRSELVRKQTSQIKFEGDLSIWISQSSFVLFTLVKNTCEWYMTAFRDNRMASGFVSWAVEQIEHFGEIFRRQVYEGEENEAAVNEYISVAKAHAVMLKEVGLDFEFMLDGVLSKSGHSLRKKKGVEEIQQLYQENDQQRKTLMLNVELSSGGRSSLTGNKSAP